MSRKRDGKEVKIRKSIRVEPRIVSRLESEFGSFSAGINEILKKRDSNMIGPGLADLIEKEILKEQKRFFDCWGVEHNSEESVELGSHETIGGDIYDDTISTGGVIDGLERALSLIRILDQTR